MFLSSSFAKINTRIASCYTTVNVSIVFSSIFPAQNFLMACLYQLVLNHDGPVDWVSSLCVAYNRRLSMHEVPNPSLRKNEGLVQLLHKKLEVRDSQCELTICSETHHQSKNFSPRTLTESPTPIGRSSQRHGVEWASSFVSVAGSVSHCLLTCDPESWQTEFYP